jgi:hypothetical protein
MRPGCRLRGRARPSKLIQWPPAASQSEELCCPRGPQIGSSCIPLKALSSRCGGKSPIISQSQRVRGCDLRHIAVGAIWARLVNWRYCNICYKIQSRRQGRAWPRSGIRPSQATTSARKAGGRGSPMRGPIWFRLPEGRSLGSGDRSSPMVNSNERHHESQAKRSDSGSRL